MTTFDFTQLPTYLDNQIGVGTFVAGLLLSLVFEMFVLIPVMLMTRGKYFSLYMVFFFAVAAPLVGLGWFPIWLYIILILAIALGFGEKIAGWIGGVRK